eukprot:7546367-Alexandrium_andersonii.AAC.1
MLIKLRSDGKGGPKALDEGAVALPQVAIKLRVAPVWRGGSRVVAEQGACSLVWSLSPSSARGA